MDTIRDYIESRADQSIKRENELAGDEPDEGEAEPERKDVGLER